MSQSQLLLASKIMSRESLRRLIFWVGFLHSISMTKERFFFFLCLAADQKLEVRKKVVLQFLGGAVARIKSCVPCSMRTI